MKRIDINGISYAVPFENLLRPLSPSEWDSLVASVKVNGVISNLQVATTHAWGRIILDGMHRATIAEQLDIDVPVTNRGDLTDEKARELALSLNLDRRHMTPEEQQAARAARIKRVAKAREDGDSLRVIADREDISVTMVVRDLEDCPTEVATPKHVVASNGSVHRSTQPRRSTKKTPVDRAEMAVRALTAAVRAILKSQQRARLVQVAEAAGAPIDKTEWPHLDLLRSIIRDVSNGGLNA